MVGELSFIFKQRSREKRTWNIDGNRVDKDLFKAGTTLDTFLCTPSFYFITDKFENRTAFGSQRKIAPRLESYIF